MNEQVSHKAFLQQVYDYARHRGWLVYWTWKSKHSPPGFPDLCMARGDRLIFAELKTRRDKLRPAQVVWIEALMATGKVDVFVWRPEDWLEIEEALEP